MTFVSNSPVENSPGYVAFEGSPVHLVVLVVAVLLLALTLAVLIVIWRNQNRRLLERVMWSAIALLVPVIGPIVIGIALVWQHSRDGRSP